MGLIKKRQIVIIAMSPVGNGLSGGDRIFIEIARNLDNMGNKMLIVTWNDGLRMCQRSNLDNKKIDYKIIDMHFWPQLGFVVNYFARIIYAIIWSFTVKLPGSEMYVYSSSEFWMDAFPALIIKKRIGAKWVASWFQTAPNPLKGFAEGDRKSRYRFRALLYWLSQLPIKKLVSRFADFVLVNNETERKQFPILNKNNRLLVFIGALDLGKIHFWQKKHKGIKKKHDAVFQGRFHPQKGVIELIEIWRKVVDSMPYAKLIMIGDGPLRADVEKKIKQYSLTQNVDLLGYVFDGDKKYQAFSESKLVVHPALYDSGGMASAEAMAFGLPCIGFELKAYESYYPKGMIKAKIGDSADFASKIVLLLRDKSLYNATRSDALSLVKNNWTWEDRAREFQEFIQK